MPRRFFHRPDRQHFFAGMNEHFHEPDLAELLDTRRVEMDTFRGKGNTGHTGDLKELSPDHLKSPQIKITGLRLDAAGFNVCGRFTGAQGRFPVVLRVKSGPARIHRSKASQHSFRYGVNLRQNAPAAVFGVAEQLLYRKVVLRRDDRLMLVLRKIAEAVPTVFPGLVIQVIGREGFSRPDGSAMALISQDSENAAGRPYRISPFCPAA